MAGILPARIAEWQDGTGRILSLQSILRFCNSAILPLNCSPWPTTSSFDITSPVDFAEVDNALNQARKEIGQRYDFKGATAEITLNATEKTLTLLTDDEMKMNARVGNRAGASWSSAASPTKNFKNGDSEPAAGGKVRRVITIQQGIPIEAAREIVKFIKDQKLKKGAGSHSGRPAARHAHRRRTSCRPPCRCCAATTSASRCILATIGRG